ncbi:MAG: nuclear transport factor 2 family protein [Pseudomonadota bacterium]
MPGLDDKRMQALDAMLGAWNAAEPELARRLLDEALAPGVVFVDPNYEIEGIDAFEAMVLALRKAQPGHVASRTSDVDAHHDVCRYAWRVTLPDGSHQNGMDVTRFDADGKVLRVDGFFAPSTQKNGGNPGPSGGEDAQARP